MIQLKVPEKCIDCPSIRLMIPTGGHYCVSHVTNPELDISTNAVDPESKPEWCPIDKMNESIRGMTPEKREAFKKVAEGMNTLFEGSGFGTGLEFVDVDEKKLREALLHDKHRYSEAYHAGYRQAIHDIAEGNINALTLLENMDKMTPT